MASSQVFIARDDAGGNDITYGGGTWATTIGQWWFGGSTTWPRFAENTTLKVSGSMSFSFQGVAVALYGNTPKNLISASQDFQVIIDGAPAYKSSTTDTKPQTYMQWYQSPLLAQGSHTVTLKEMYSALDLILITPGPDTPLASQTLMVDDVYDGITYTGGGWKEVRDKKYAEGSASITAQPFQNGTHQTSNVGDSLSFSYTGTNLQLYGVFLPSITGSISLTYSIDDGSAFQKSYTGTGSTSPDYFNYLLVDTGPLSPGNHTVNVNLTGAIGQTLIVDYILYTPSFQTLATMPNLTAPSSTTQPESTSISSSTAAGESSSTVPPSHISSSKKISTGAIAGGVVGGVVFLALLLVFLLFWCRKRRAKSGQHLDTASGRPRNETMNYQVEQFVPSMQEYPLSSPTSEISSSGGEKLSTLSPQRRYSNGVSGGTPVASLPSGAPASPFAVAQRRSEIARRLRELTELVAQSETHDDNANSGPSTSTWTSSGNVRGENEDTGELRRRIAELTEENERLASMSEPPAYVEH